MLTLTSCTTTCSNSYSRHLREGEQTVLTFIYISPSRRYSDLLGRRRLHLHQLPRSNRTSRSCCLYSRPPQSKPPLQQPLRPLPPTPSSAAAATAPIQVALLPGRTCASYLHIARAMVTQRKRKRLSKAMVSSDAEDYKEDKSLEEDESLRTTQLTSNAHWRRDVDNDGHKSLRTTHLTSNEQWGWDVYNDGTDLDATETLVIDDAVAKIQKLSGRNGNYGFTHPSQTKSQLTSRWPATMS